MRRLYIARHGETAWNLLRRLQGATDIPLNAEGRTQAQQLGETLRTAGVVTVVTSPLMRARETGEIAAAVLGLSVGVTDPDLRERSFGVFEGLTREELEDRFAEPWRDWQARGVVPSGGEPTDEVVSRMQRALERILARAEPTLVVSHGAAMRLVLTALGGHPTFPIPNGAIYRVDAYDGTPVVTPWGAPPTD